MADYTPTRTVKLYRLNKNGSVQYFTLELYLTFPGHHPGVVTRKGILHGAEQVDVYEVTEGKNIGKANETTPEQQAEVKFNTILNKQLDRGYIQNDFNDPDFIQQLKAANGRDAKGELLPMLAYKTCNHIKFPAYIQRKYDGVRCFVGYKADGAIHMTSRRGKEFLHLRHIIDDLEGVLKPDEILDGELYSDKLNFQEIVSAVKREQPLNKEIKLRAYDVANDKSQHKRLVRLKVICRNSGPSITWVPTDTANSMVHAMEYARQFIEEGYEGAILRDINGKYEFGKRSRYLAKYKEFDEEECKIIGVEEATGRDAGTAIFICETKKGVRFNCRPMGDRDLRKEYFENQDDYINKMLTVKYQGLSVDGVPRFPIGKTIRDYE